MRLFLVEVALKDNKRRLRRLSILADDEQEAIQQTAVRSFEHVLRVRELTGLLKFITLAPYRSPREKDFRELFTKIAHLLFSGIALKQALLLQLNAISNPKTRCVLCKIIQAVRQGKSLSEAFREHVGVFSQNLIALVQVAERTGDLEAVLEKIGENQRKSEQLAKQFMSELIYPIIVVIVAMATAFLFVIFYMPALQEIYNNCGAQLPIVSRVLLSLVQAAKKVPLLILIPVLCVGYVFKNFHRLFSNKRFQGVFYLFPGIGHFMWQKDLALALEQFSLLLGSKLSAREAINSLVSFTGNWRIKSILSSIREKVTAGMSLSLAFQQEVPNFQGDGEELANVIEIGEVTGDLEKVLYAFSANYSKELYWKLANFNKILKPLLLLVASSFVAFVIVSVLYPIAKLGTVMIQQFNGMGGV